MKVNPPNQSIDYKPMPKGSHVVRLYGIYDLGTQEDMNGKKTPQQYWLYEAPKKLMDDGKPFTIGEYVTMSTNSKAKLMNRLINWLGQNFPKGSENEFGFFYKVDGSYTTYQFLGSYGRMSVSHNESGKAVVDAVSALDDDTPEPAGVNALVKFDIDAPDAQAVFETLPKWIQDKVSKSPEWQAKKTEGLKSEGEPVF